MRSSARGEIVVPTMRKSTKRRADHEMRFVGTGAGTPLPLIHGIGGTHRSWDPIATPLASEHELIAVDLPGHG